ncbi:MAG TPA: c-type cytochrome [Gemmatimonadales bacterium]|nr:c-type cytochrome [Gemmatimonadales bacterium]
MNTRDDGAMRRGRRERSGGRVRAVTRGAAYSAFVAGALGLAGMLAGLTGCGNGNADAVESGRAAVPGGDADRGKQEIVAYGCGTCHMIPGVDNANGLVGPPLLKFGRRTYIAGEVPNTTDFLIRWLEVPQAIEPGTDMPNLGITEQQARDIAAYLYTLR